MAATKISELGAASALDGTEALPVVQGGSTVKALVSAIRTYILGLANSFSAKQTFTDVDASGSVLQPQGADATLASARLYFGTDRVTGSPIALNFFNNSLYMLAQGQQAFLVNATKVALNSGQTLSWTNSGTNNDATQVLQLHRDADDTLAQRRSTNAQAFRVYNTYTDASNYERLGLYWSSNVLRLETEKAGTGSNRALDLRGGGFSMLKLDPSANALWGMDQQTAGIMPYANGSSDIGSSTRGYKRFYIDYTNTATVGAVTINKTAGRVNIAAAGTSVVVTNSLCTAAAKVFAMVCNADATAYVKNVVPAAGSFTIELGAAATAETAINFFIVNSD